MVLFPFAGCVPVWEANYVIQSFVTVAFQRTKMQHGTKVQTPGVGNHGTKVGTPGVEKLWNKTT